MLIKKDIFAFFVVYVDDILLFAHLESMLQGSIDHFEKIFETILSQTFNTFLCFPVDDDDELIKLHNKPMMRKVTEAFQHAWLQTCEHAFAISTGSMK